MKKILFTLMALFFCLSIFAQRQNFMYPDREALAFYDSVKFVNTEFYQGLVVTKDGKLSGGKMNICTIDQKIHFINDKGDTLVIKDNENVQTVSIIGKTYINTIYGYIQILEITENVSMGVLNLLEVHIDAPIGAYGLRNQTGAVKRLTSIDASLTDAYSGIHGSAKTLLFEKETEYPFSYRMNPFILVNGVAYPATEKVFVEYFPDKKEYIRAYIKEYNTNFNSVESVRDLFMAMNGE